MKSVLSRSANADQLEAAVRDATCCTSCDRCLDCLVKLEEVRAVRREALMHTIGQVRPRRPAW